MLRLFFMEKWRTVIIVHCCISIPDWRKCCLSSICIYFSLSSRFSCPRSGVAMPFGCLTIGEKKDYNNPSDVTDKYDLGQIVKSWVSQTASTRASWIRLRLPSLQGLCSYNPMKFFLSGRSSARYSEPRTEPPWRCTRVKSSWRRTEGRSARLPKMRSSSWRCEFFCFFLIGSCSLQLQHLYNKCLALIPSFYLISLFILPALHHPVPPQTLFYRVLPSWSASFRLKGADVQRFRNQFHRRQFRGNNGENSWNSSFSSVTSHSHLTPATSLNLRRIPPLSPVII